MPKYTDVIRDGLQDFFDAGDQPSEANFDELILRIQEGIEEHDHDGTGDGDSSVALTGVLMADNAWIGIGAALERIVFDTAGDVAVMGASFGVGLLAPGWAFEVYGDQAGAYIAYFFNDGNNINRHGIGVQGGADDPATVGTTYFFSALDGDADLTGALKTVNGVFQLADISDSKRKVKIKDTKKDCLGIVNKLKVRDYNWKTNPDGPVMTSFIAQEAQEVYPDMIGEFPDGTLNTSRAMLIPILVKAIQEQQKQIKALQGG